MLSWYTIRTFRRCWPQALTVAASQRLPCHLHGVLYSGITTDSHSKQRQPPDLVSWRQSNKASCIKSTHGPLARKAAQDGHDYSLEAASGDDGGFAAAANHLHVCFDQPNKADGLRYVYTQSLNLSSSKSRTTVYKAQDQYHEGGFVAVKGLAVKAVTSWKQLESLEHEASMLQSLRHPGIPSYLTSFQHDSNGNEGLFLVQELVEGENLSQMMSAGWRPTELDVAHIASEVLAVLGYLHQHHVVHSAIEPEHIMLRGGQAKSSVTLVGFGNAQRVGHDNVTFQDPDFEGLTGGGKLSGGCKAPEQLAGEARSASDMYGLGCSLLYLLTGMDHPALGMDLRHVSKSPGLNRLLQGLLLHKWQDRPTAVQAQQILLDAHQQPELPQSSQVVQAQWMPIPKEVIARRCTPSFQKVGGARKLSRSRFAQHRPPQTTALASGSTKPVIQYASIQDAQEDLQAVMSAVKALLEAQASTSAQSSTHNQVVAMLLD